MVQNLVWGYEWEDGASETVFTFHRIPALLTSLRKITFYEILCLVSTHTRTIYVIMLRYRWAKRHTQIKLVSQEWTAHVWSTRFTRVSGIGTGQTLLRVGNKEQKREQRALRKTLSTTATREWTLEQDRLQVREWRCGFLLFITEHALKISWEPFHFDLLKSIPKLIKCKKTTELLSIYLFFDTDKYYQNDMSLINISEVKVPRVLSFPRAATILIYKN